MFDALMGMFNNPLFWMMVVATVVGYIFAQALPYVIIFFAYVLGAVVFILGAIAGLFIGLYKGAVQAIKDAKK